MFKALQVQGPIAPGQFGAMQVSGPSAYYPMQTTNTITDMMNAMMPMLMMFMMMAMIMPMMKGITGKG